MYIKIRLTPLRNKPYITICCAFFYHNTKYWILLLSGVFNVSLGCRKARDGHAVGRAGNIVQADFMAELD